MIFICWMFVFSVFQVSFSGDNSCGFTVYVENSNVSIGCMKRNVNVSEEIFDCDSLTSVFTMMQNVKCIEILLHPGTHLLTDILVTSANVTMKPVLNDSRTAITCSSELSQQIQEHHFNSVPIIHFLHSDLVEIHNMNFEGCSGIIAFQNISNLKIFKSTFRYFTEGAVDVYDTPNVLVRDTVFEHNGPVSKTLKTFGRFVVHSGGLSIGTYRIEKKMLNPPKIVIHNCIFTNNTAFPDDELQKALTEVHIQNVFNGRGGGLGIVLSSPQHSYSVLITNCSFIGNGAKLLGGGLYITTDRGTSHNITLDGNTFIENWSGFAAGGIFSGSFGPGTEAKFDQFVYKNCQFNANKAERGGGIVYAVPGTQGGQNMGIWNYLKLKNCDFESNRASGYAAALWLASVDPYSVQLTHKPVDIINCTFVSNISPRNVVVGSLFVPVILSGSNTFDRNLGTAIELFGSVAEFKDQVEFSNTDSEFSNSGALHLVSFAQIVLHEESFISFINNTGSFGASITVVSQTTSEAFSKILYNQLCFLRYQDNQVSPDDWNVRPAADYVQIEFLGNMATLGPIAYMYSIDPCSWTQLKEPYFNTSRVLKWASVVRQDNKNSFHTNYQYSDLFSIQTQPTHMKVSNKSITVYPGEQFALHIVASDELGHSVGIAITLTNTLGFILLEPSGHILLENSQLIYLRALYSGMTIDINQVYEVEVQGFAESQTLRSAFFSLKLNNCPPGYLIDKNNEQSECKCTNENPQVVSCMGSTVTLKNGFWGSQDTSSDDHLFTYPCPEAYCNCIYDEEGTNCANIFDNNDPDSQCVCGRQGILCGECNNVSSYTLLFLNCVDECDNNEWILVLLGIFEALVIAVLVRLLLHKKYPSWVFPILFYMQFLSISTNSIANGFNSFYVYLYYIFSVCSFYFPYDFCLSNRIGPLGLYSLRLLPFLISFVVVPATLGLSWKWLKRSSQPWYSVWMLILLLYSHTLLAAISILFCPFIPDNNVAISRWYLAGQVECYSGEHLPIALLAILISVLCVLLILGTYLLSLVNYQLLQFVKKLRESLIDIISLKYKWFYSFELFRRFLPIVLVVVFPGNKYPVFFAFLVLNGIVVYLQPHSSSVANNIERVLFVITTLLYIISFQDFSSIPPISRIKQAKDCAMHSGDNKFLPVSTFLIGILCFFPVIVGIVISIYTVFRKACKYKESCYKGKRRSYTLHLYHLKQHLLESDQKVIKTTTIQ